MKLIRRYFDVDSRTGSIEIDLYADTHLGSASVDEALLRKHIKETKETGRHWGFLGDGIDGVLPSDRKRFSPQNITDWAWVAYKNKRLIRAQYERFAELFAPIADRCLFYIAGDGKHSASENVADCREEMCRFMNVPGPFQTVYYQFIIRRAGATTKTLNLVFHHGYFAGRTAGSKLNNLERCLSYFPEAAGFFCGHGHTKASTPPQACLVARGSHMASFYRRAAMTGSYLKTYSEDTTGYGEVRFYPPSALGRITVRLAPYHSDDQKHIEIFNN